MKKIKPQPGPQEQCLASSADIVIYGGAAGGGKTWSLLVEPLRHIHNPDFTAIIFRRTSVQIRNPGGLWDESQKIYPLLGAKGTDSSLWVFPSGAKIKFSHLEHEKNKNDHQGAQYAFIGFDEATHFTWGQFTYLVSRNRSMCGIRPYMRLTCNPDPESWVKNIIAWWLDDSGFAISERSGVIRWFLMINDELVWADNPQELIKKYRTPEHTPEPLSFTFIHSSLSDNKILTTIDPSYIAKLNALPYIERMQLLEGNWKISFNDGIIKREWFQYYRELPVVKRYFWSWDTAIKAGQDNDFSAGQLWAECENGYFLIEAIKEKLEYPELKRLVEQLYNKQPASQILIEDKSSGQQLVQDFRRIGRLPVKGVRPGKEMPHTKEERLNFCSPLFEAGKIFIPENAHWASDYINELCIFPNGQHDDQVDATTQFLCSIIQRNKPSIRVL